MLGSDAVIFSNLGVFGLVMPALDFSREGVLLGGLLTSTLSCVLLAELAVGRIMRARKPSSAALVRERDSGFLVAADEAGRVVEDLAAGLAPSKDARGCLWVLGGGLAATAGLASCLAADAAVGAVRFDDSFVGRADGLEAAGA